MSIKATPFGNSKSSFSSWSMCIEDAINGRPTESNTAYSIRNLVKFAHDRFGEDLTNCILWPSDSYRASLFDFVGFIVDQLLWQLLACVENQRILEHTEKSHNFKIHHLTGPGRICLAILNRFGTPGSLLTGNPVVYVPMSENPRHSKLSGFLGFICLTRYNLRMASLFSISHTTAGSVSVGIIPT